MHFHRTLLVCLVMTAGSALGMATAGAQTMTPVTPATVCDGTMTLKQIATVAQQAFPGSRIIKIELEVEHAPAGRHDDGSGHDQGDDHGGSGSGRSGRSGSGGGNDDPTNHDTGDDHGAGGGDDGTNHDVGDDHGGNSTGDDNGGQARTCQYEVTLLQANRIVEARFDAVTGALVSSEVDTNPSRVVRLKSQAKNAKITFAKAIELAQRRAGDDRPVKLELREETSGRTYRVEFMDDRSGAHTAVHVHSKNQRITRVDR